MDHYGEEILRVAILVALTYGFFNLLAVWVGLSRRHWLLRAAILCSSLLPFQALDSPHPSFTTGPILNLACGMFLIVTVLHLWRSHGNRRAFSFQLRDLMLVLTFVAVLLGAAAA